MNYIQIKEDYKYDTLAEAIYSREMEFFHYEFDLINYRHLEETVPDGDYKNDIKNRIADIQKQMNIVDDMYNALQTQIIDQTAYMTAVERVTQKREAQSQVPPVETVA